MAKEFAKKGAPFKTDNVYMPWDDAKGKSKGCVCTTRSS